MVANQEGKYIGLAKLGPKSQVVIPKEVREMFGIGPGDQVLILADKERGIALVDPEEYVGLIDKLLPPKGGPNAPAD